MTKTAVLDAVVRRKVTLLFKGWNEPDHCFSNKLYHLRWSQMGATHVVSAAWGGVGNRLQVQQKYAGLDEAAARSTFRRILDEKLRKGYVEEAVAA